MLEIKNNKQIEAFYVKLDGKNLHISGDTGQGKTTAISGLWDVFEKKSDQLTHGKEKGFVRITLGDGEKTIIAERRFTKKTNLVRITYENGERITAQDFTKMISKLSVNPHRIMDLKPQARINMLLESADLGGLDLTSMNSMITKLEETRLTQHREAVYAEPGEKPEKSEMVNISELVEKKVALEAGKTSYKTHVTEVENLESGLKRLESSLKEVENRIKDIKSKLKANQTYLDDPKNKQDQAEIDKTNRLIIEAQSINQKAADYERWEQQNKKHENAVKAHEETGKEIKKRKNAKKRALELAKWPIPGLSIEDDKILYNGIEFENLGESEMMLVCSGLAVNEIKNHPIRVVRLDGVESMSQGDFKKLVDLFCNLGVQVLSTRVSRGDKEENEIVITNGKYTDQGK